jgi:hypothetical protein
VVIKGPAQVHKDNRQINSLNSSRLVSNKRNEWIIDLDRAEMIARKFQDPNLEELIFVNEDLRPFITQMYK